MKCPASDLYMLRSRGALMATPFSVSFTVLSLFLRKLRRLAPLPFVVKRSEFCRRRQNIPCARIITAQGKQAFVVTVLRARWQYLDRRMFRHPSTSKRNARQASRMIWRFDRALNETLYLIFVRARSLRHALTYHFITSRKLSFHEATNARKFSIGKSLYHFRGDHYCITLRDMPRAVVVRARL
jgi:hypothetical protein